MGPDVVGEGVERAIPGLDQPALERLERLGGEGVEVAGAGRAVGDEAGARAPGGTKPADRPVLQRDRQHMTDKPKPGPAKVPDNALAAAFSKAGLAPRK